MSLFNELKRRNVFRVGIAYIVVAWLALQVADVILNNIDSPDWVFRAILLTLAIGFPFVLLFAWAFELTPEGLKRESEVDRSLSITSNTGRKLNSIILALLMAAAGYFFWESRFSNRVPAPTPSTDVSIAVLPFVNMSSDPEQDYFSDGISEEILNALAHIPNLHVTSRSSAFQFKGDDIDIPTVAAQLGVAHVLEGSVRKSGNQLRITAQLIEAKSDRHLWSETYDRQLTDVFVIQDEISLAIVDALKKTLGIEIDAPIAVKGQDNAEAYNEYLLGVYQMELRGAQPLEEAIAHFERAIKIDPDYVPALARLSMSLNLIPGYVSGLSWQDYIEKAEPFTRRAYELDTLSWESNLAMGLQAWRKAREAGVNPNEAVPYFEKALELNPSYGTAYAWLASVNSIQGEIAGSLDILEEAIKIAPLDRILLDNLAGAYIRRGRGEDAQLVIDRLLTLSPYMAYSRSAHLATAEGRWADNAIALIQKLAVSPDSRNYWARRIIGDDLGLPAEALTVGGSDSYCGLYIYLHRDDEAVSCREKQLELDSGIYRLFAEGENAFLQGEIKQGHALMEQAWLQWDRSVPSLPSPIMIAGRLAVGDNEGARELLDQTIEYVESRREAGIFQTTHVRAKGMAYYLLGEKKLALPLLQQTIDAGLYIRTFQNYREAFRNDPDILPLLARQKAKTEMERERFLTIMCGPANPVQDYWRPSEAACNMLDEQGSE